MIFFRSILLHVILCLEDRGTGIRKMYRPEGYLLVVKTGCESLRGIWKIFEIN